MTDTLEDMINKGTIEIEYGVLSEFKPGEILGLLECEIE